LRRFVFVLLHSVSLLDDRFCVCDVRFDAVFDPFFDLLFQFVK
jgi:hypothetical protein